MLLVKLISRLCRRTAPALWQQLKYQQYLFDPSAEHEIHVVHRYIDPDRAALDIGVHIGIYTRHFAKYAKCVLGFEANPNSAAFAKRSLNGIATIEWVGLSSEAGTGLLRIPAEEENRADLAAFGTLSPTNRLGGLRFREVVVPVRTLDDFDLPAVGFVKIDVEGHEEAVLKGGEKLLARDRPVYMIEIEERHNAGALARIVQYFDGWEYDASFYDGTKMRTIKEFKQQAHQAMGSRIYINNFFFCPRERDLLKQPRCNGRLGFSMAMNSAAKYK
jgi:FkbM family methyltransferase